MKVQFPVHSTLIFGYLVILSASGRADGITLTASITVLPMSSVQMQSDLQVIERTKGPTMAKNLMSGFNDSGLGKGQKLVHHGQTEVRWSQAQFWAKSFYPVLGKDATDQNYEVLCDPAVFANKSDSGAVLSTPTTEYGIANVANRIAFTGIIPVELKLDSRTQSGNVLTEHWSRSLFHLVQERVTMISTKSVSDETLRIDSSYIGRDGKPSPASHVLVTRHKGVLEKMHVVNFASGHPVTEEDYAFVSTSKRNPPTLGEFLPNGTNITDMRLTEGAPMVRLRQARPVNYAWEGHLPSLDTVVQKEAVAVRSTYSPASIAAILIGACLLVVPSLAKLLRRFRHSTPA